MSPLLLLPVLVLIVVVVSSWEELESKRECDSQRYGLWCFSVGLGSMSGALHGAFAGRFDCISHSVTEVVAGRGNAGCPDVVSVTVGEVVTVVAGAFDRIVLIRWRDLP